MTNSLGIVGALRRKETLEHRIERHLASVPTDAQLKGNYVEPSDRQRVRGRALIGALLGAIYEHGNPEAVPEGLELEIDSPPVLSSELAAARRDYLHDAELLNSGRKAELLMRPT